MNALHAFEERFAIRFTELPSVTRSSTGFEIVPVDDEIPASFWVGLADIKAGRIVDVDRAHHEAPPGE